MGHNNSQISGKKRKTNRPVLFVELVGGTHIMKNIAITCLALGYRYRLNETDATLRITLHRPVRFDYFHGILNKCHTMKDAARRGACYSNQRTYERHVCCHLCVPVRNHVDEVVSKRRTYLLLIVSSILWSLTSC